MNTYFAKNLGMSAHFDDKRAFSGATLLQILPMTVSSLRTKDKNGYFAIQLDIAGKKKEVRVNEADLASFTPGTAILFDGLNVGDLITVTGTSKGKGFAGGVKRHGFKGGPRTHGQSDRERAPGGSSSGTTLGRLQKGKRMAGRMGNETINVRNLKILSIDTDKMQILIRGAVPGSKAALLTIEKV